MTKSKPLLLEKYIYQAKKEVATWPEWKKKQALLYCSEDQRKQKEEYEKEKSSKLQNKL